MYIMVMLLQGGEEDQKDPEKEEDNKEEEMDVKDREEGPPEGEPGLEPQVAIV